MLPSDMVLRSWFGLPDMVYGLPPLWLLRATDSYLEWVLRTAAPPPTLPLRTQQVYGPSSLGQTFAPLPFTRRAGRMAAAYTQYLSPTTYTPTPLPLRHRHHHTCCYYYLFLRFCC